MHSADLGSEHCFGVLYVWDCRPVLGWTGVLKLWFQKPFSIKGRLQKFSCLAYISYEPSQTSSLTFTDNQRYFILIHGNL